MSMRYDQLCAFLSRLFLELWPITVKAYAALFNKRGKATGCGFILQTEPNARSKFS